MASSTSAPLGRPLSDAGHKRLSSFPSRQRRMGPAPLASFEDLSMDKTNSDHSSSSPDDQHKAALSEIGEEESGGLASSVNTKEILSVPTSPKIRVEAASSPSQHDDSDSKESTPEKEHFAGYKKEEFCEEMSDLQHSTEELDAEEEKARKQRLKVQQQLIEAERREKKLKLSEVRKGSSSSVISDGLLPVTSGHSSRLSSLGSIGAPARRSPSPHKMLLETSFCGNKPIQHPSIDIEDPPISTSDIMQYAIAKLETIKSPLEAKPPNIFRSTSPAPEKSVAQEISSAQTKPSTIYNAKSKPDATLPQVKSQEAQNLHSKPPSISKVESKPLSTTDVQSNPTRQHEITKLQVRSQEPTKSLQRRQEQQRRQAEHHEYYQRHVEQAETLEKKIYKEPSSLQNEENRQKELEIEKLRWDTLPRASERQSRLEKRQTGTSPRSPRLGKKVPTPQVPELKDLPRTSPSSPASSATATTPDFYTARSSKSTTPGESPRSTKEIIMKEKTSDKNGSTPSLVRKGSFASIFRKSESGLSPVTPDSPGSSGRKSPFSQFIKNAENKIRSRSRSRSRSKSRDRELDDDTHDRRKVLSIFKPLKKKKRENGAESDKGAVTVEDQKSKDPINNVEFKFNSEGTYQPSSFGSARHEIEISRAIKEPLRRDKMESEVIPSAEPPQVQDSSANDYSPYINEATEKGSITENFSEEVTKSLKAREEELKKLEKAEDDFSKEESAKESLPEIPSKEIAKTSSPSSKDKVSATILQVQNDQDDSLSISESERGSEIEYFKKKEKAASSAHAESPDNENKGLVSQDSLEEDELPFVPTTLPQERSIVPHIIPVKERAPKLKMTQSIDRPRSTTPIQPSRLEEYKQSSQELIDQEADKLTISIKVPQPGAVKVLPTRAPKRQGSKSWEDFCSEGLRSPRQLRRQYKEKQQASSETASSPPPPPPPPPLDWKSPTKDKARSLPETPRASVTTSATRSSTMATPPKWINFDEMPSIVLKPVRQIKTLPPKRLPTQPSLESFKQKREFFSFQQKEVTPPLSLRDTPKAEDSDKESEEHSSEESEDEKPTSISSSEELSTVRETIEKFKQNSSEDTYENSDLERLLAPVNECISKLSSLASSAESQPAEQRRSPIPDNWEDFLLPPQPGRRSRLSSLGSDAGSIGMRSPSPSVMLLETSFCGNQPIDDPALAEPDVPIPVARKLSGISLGDLSPLTQRGDRASLHSGQYLTQPDRTSVISDSSAEGGSPRGSDYDLSENQRGQQGGQGHLNPFGMDLELKSNRSSVISQDQSSPETTFFSSGHRT